MIRPGSTPWIHRTSRRLIAATAAVGALTTGYLTIEKLTGGSAACIAQTGIKGCNDVLSSPWATVFGQPLALFGFLAYTSIAIFALVPLVGRQEKNNHSNQNLENWTWWLLFLESIAMAVFSSYLMYLLVYEIKVLCIYCIASALFSFTILVLTIIGRSWEDFGQVSLVAIIVGMITFILALGVYSGVNQPATAATVKISFAPIEPPNPVFGWEITTNSTEAEIELAQHLRNIGAKEYIAYWCPHCQEQKLLFGKQAYELISNSIKVECAPDSPLAKPDLCKAEKIEGYPTWVINGKSYSGVQTLQQLAQASDYKGSQDFKYYR